MIACALALVAPAQAAAPARLQVTAAEYSFTLSRPAIKAGPAIIELVNFGEDPHDLVVRRIAPAARTFRLRALDPGAHDDLSLRLGAGRYRLWCSVGDHRARGMQAVLRVTK